MSGPVSRSGAARAPSGVSSCCSSPLAHRALITISACLSGPSWRRLPEMPRPVPDLPMTGLPVTASPTHSPTQAPRRALGIARRRLARAKQSKLGCRYAPRPGLCAAGSATISPPTATTRSKSDLAARLPHPTHVRITDPGMAGNEDRMAALPSSLQGRRVGGTWHWVGQCRTDSSTRLACLIVRLDIDAPVGQPGRQPDVLAFFADGQRELVVGHDHLGDPGCRVKYPHLRDPGGRQRMADELGRVFGVVDDVDLLAMQLGHHVAYPAAHRADAGAFGVDPWLPGDHGDLRAVPGFSGDGGDLHRAGGDLGNLKRE